MDLDVEHAVPSVRLPLDLRAIDADPVHRVDVRLGPIRTDVHRDTLAVVRTHGAKGRIQERHDVLDAHRDRDVGAVQEQVVDAREGARWLPGETDRHDDRGSPDRLVQASQGSFPEALGHGMRCRLEATEEQPHHLFPHLGDVLGRSGRRAPGARHDAGHGLERSPIVHRGTVELHGGLDDTDPEVVLRDVAPAPAVRVDVLDPILGAYHPVDVGGERGRAWVAAIPRADVDLEAEVIGGAVGQHDARRADLRF